MLLKQKKKVEGGYLEFNHKPVLLKECIEGLNIKEDGVYVDGTLGGAGHSKEILKRLSDKGTLIGIDRDIDALNAAKINLAEFNNVKYVHGNHDDIKTILNDLDIEKSRWNIIRFRSFIISIRRKRKRL